MTSTTIDPAETAHFNEMAPDWWNPRGSSAPLHMVNPVRLSYLRGAVEQHFGRAVRTRDWLSGLDVLDIGCGGGILTEPMARLGGQVTGIDGAEDAINIALAHAEGGGLPITYRALAAESLAEEAARFDLITSMEVVEHVADVPAFLAAIAKLLKPGGLFVFSTPNRTRLSHAALIVGAEQILRLLPRGTHDWNRFLTPEELNDALASAGMTVTDTSGISFRPSRGFTLSDDRRVNYIGSAIPEAEAS